MGVLVGALGVLYGALFKIEIANYLPFVAAGFVGWGLISGLITDGCTVFTEAGGIIKQVRLPLSVHVYRVVWRNYIIFAHNAVIFVIVAILFSVRPGWAGLLSIPGLVLVCLNGVWIGLLLGLLGARFRDVPEVIASALRIVFFLTPVFWKPELLPDRALVLDLNPFFYLLEVVRAPLLGQVPTPTTWLATLGITLAGWLVTAVFYTSRRGRIAYWV